MNDEFVRLIKRDDKLREVSEIGMGNIVDADRLNVFIPLCCIEGWDSCPHIPKKHKPRKRNVGL